MDKIKVLIVEDSKVMQQVLKDIITSDEELEFVGVAADPLIARDLIKSTHPDVITLDIMLPHMDGITFLKNIMRLRPMPVVMVSNLTEKGSALALEALAIGAVDYLAKPTHHETSLLKFKKQLTQTIKHAAKANIHKQLPATLEVDKKFHQLMDKSELLNEEIIVIGASTGGIEALETVLIQLPQVFPPIVIVQHIKHEFSTAFANRISRVYKIAALVPENNTALLPGYIYIAPANYHITVSRKQDKYIVQYDNSPPVKNHKPSIDILFNSVAKAAGSHAIGILLTGMGSDGAAGLQQIYQAGGKTIVQDKATSMVWGMPGAAVKLNVVDYIVPLNAIHQQILQIIDDKIFNNKISLEKIQ